MSSVHVPPWTLEGQEPLMGVCLPPLACEPPHFNLSLYLALYFSCRGKLEAPNPSQTTLPINQDTARREPSE